MRASAPTFRLDDRRALVTGAGRGIGLAAAHALAEAGAHVVLAARSGDPAQLLVPARERPRPLHGVRLASRIRVPHYSQPRA